MHIGEPLLQSKVVTHVVRPIIRRPQAISNVITFLLCSTLQPRALSLLNHVVLMDLQLQSNYNVKYGHSDMFTTYNFTKHHTICVSFPHIHYVHVTIIFRCNVSLVPRPSRAPLEKRV